MEKYKKIILWGIFIVGIIFFIKYFGLQPFSLIKIEGPGSFPVQEKQIIWKGLTVNLAGYLGSHTTSSNLRICGDNDGKVSILNNYKVNDELILTSSISGRRQECGYNFIYADMVLPPGVLFINYDLSRVGSEIGDNGESHAILNIRGDNINIHLDSYNCDPNRYGCGVDKYGRFNSILSPGNINLTMDKPSKIHIELLTSKSYYGSSTAKVKLNFKKRIKVYRLENNQCNLYEIYEDEKQTNDYLTLEDCKKYIITPKKTYYRYDPETNSCKKVLLYSGEVTNNDYLTLEECEFNILPSANYSKVIFVLILTGAGITGLTYLFLRFRKK